MIGDAISPEEDKRLYCALTHTGNLGGRVHLPLATPTEASRTLPLQTIASE